MLSFKVNYRVLLEHEDYNIILHTSLTSHTPHIKKKK